MKLAPQTIEALAQIISGGSGNDPTPSIGVYRSGSRLESFMRACGVSMSVGSGSRLPALIAALEDVNRREDEKDIASLYKGAREPLGLAPEKAIAHDLIVDDVRSVLSGLITTVQGIGALRTHGGDAHGREAGKPRSIDGRIARLAIHPSGAAALFMIETWQRRYPAKVLHQH